MRDQSVFGIVTQKWQFTDVGICNSERKRLRELAAVIAEEAVRPEQQEKKRLWTAHNSLSKTRPLIFCDPENGWNEIIKEKELKCTGQLGRIWENYLLKEIFWAQRMGDDKVVDNLFPVYYSYTDTGFGLPEKTRRVSENGAYVWSGQLTDYCMMNELHYPQIIVDSEITQRLLETAHDVFDGILEVQLKGMWWWSIGLTYALANLRGLEQMMIDMYDYPEELHKLMSFIRDGYIYKIKYLEQNGLLSLNCGNTYVGSGGFGFTNELPSDSYSGMVHTQDMWGFLESQETTSVSPEMFKEFVFEYQLPILELFGLNCYGCCEPLDKRWEIIKNIPRLRRVSVSPWTNKRVMAEYLGSDYIFSLKPNPAVLALEHADEQQIRKDIKADLLAARDCRIEVIMKDNHTIGKNPENVVQWCRIAREEAEAL